MKDYPDELEHIVHNEHSEHDIESESIRQIIDGLEIEDHYFHELQLFEIEEAIQTVQNNDSGKSLEKEPTIRPAEPDFEIVHVHPVDYPEIIYDDKKSK
jgi:hypothetical protein